MNRLVWIMLGLGVFAASSQHGSATPVDDIRILTAAGLTPQAGELLDFFEKRSHAATSSTEEELQHLTARLKGGTLEEQSQACAELVKIGPAAIPWLKELHGALSDTEKRRKVRQCLQALTVNSADVTLAALRRLSASRDERMVRVLMAFAPYSENDSVRTEVMSILAGAAYADGVANPDLVRALSGPENHQRISAAELLCQPDRKVPWGPVRALLNDADALVRFRSALALARVQDETAIPALIRMIPQLDQEDAFQVEDFLRELAAEGAPEGSIGEQPESKRKWQDAWLQWWSANTGEKLLGALKERTISDPDRRKFAERVERLGDESFATREQTSDELNGLGPNYVPLLRQAIGHNDPEVRMRLVRCLQRAEGAYTPLPASAFRLLAFRKPAGTTEAILAYLPCAHLSDNLQAAQQVLGHLVMQDERAIVPLKEAILSPEPVRRAAAAKALCRLRDDEIQRMVGRLLNDPKESVRLEVGLALAESGHRQAIPVLLEMFDRLSQEDVERVERFFEAFEDQGVPLPEEELGHLGGASPGNPRQFRKEVWSAWWAKYNGRLVLDVPRKHPSFLPGGRILVTSSATNQVMEIGEDGKPRWTISGLSNPWDVQLLPNQRVLIAEYSGRRITERTLDGKILWQHSVPGYPVGIRQLSNGNVFVVCNNLLLEVTRQNNVVYQINRPSSDVRGGDKLRNGEIVCLTSQGIYLRYNTRGEELEQWKLPPLSNYGHEVLPHGGVLIAAQSQNEVIEYDRKGRVVWRTRVTQPNAVARTRNGNVLVSSSLSPPRLLEINRNGKEIKTFSLTAAINRVITR